MHIPTFWMILIRNIGVSINFKQPPEDFYLSYNIFEMFDKIANENELEMKLLWYRPWNQCRWSCCTPRSRWRRQTRSTWCSKGDHPWAHSVDRSGTRHTANSRSDRSASPCSWPWCTLRWKSAATHNTNTSFLVLV